MIQMNHYDQVMDAIRTCIASYPAVNNYLLHMDTNYCNQLGFPEKKLPLSQDIAASVQTAIKHNLLKEMESYSQEEIRVEQPIRILTAAINYTIKQTECLSICKVMTAGSVQAFLELWEKGVKYLYSKEPIPKRKNGLQPTLENISLSFILRQLRIKSDPNAASILQSIAAEQDEEYLQLHANYSIDYKFYPSPTDLPQDSNRIQSIIAHLQEVANSETIPDSIREENFSFEQFPMSLKRQSGQLNKRQPQNQGISNMNITAQLSPQSLQKELHPFSQT